MFLRLSLVYLFVYIIWNYIYEVRKDYRQGRVHVDDESCR